MSVPESHDPLDRYARQWRYEPFGREGQERLGQSRVLICGCGALGSVIASTLARAGVGPAAAARRRRRRRRSPGCSPKGAEG